MVHLILSSTKGNQGLRYFPHTGYLGLTPVKVEGIVRTKLDDDLKPLQAKSITISVRCYEARLGRVTVLHSNVLVDHTQTLWTKPDDAEYAPVGELEFPFKIVLPTKVAGFSTSVFVDYRCSWRVEAVINHASISGIGSRQIRHFELPLVRYDLPPFIPNSDKLPPLVDAPPTKSNGSKPSRLQYAINAPTEPMGPHDIVTIPVHFLPLDPAIAIRTVSAAIDRRITLISDPSTPPASPTPNTNSSLTMPHPSLPPSQSHSPTTFYREPLLLQGGGHYSSTSIVSSNSTATQDPIYLSDSTTTLAPPESKLDFTHPSPPPSHQTSKVITNTIVSAESSGNFTRDKGLWTKLLTLHWPPPKPNSRWAVGETIFSELVQVQFFVRVKVVISSPVFGTETIELPEREVLVVSTNGSERQAAFSKYSNILNASENVIRSKSKSPRRSRRNRDVTPPSSTAGTNGDPSHKTASSLSGNSQLSKSKLVSRRPHTSAGPRDKPPTGQYHRHHSPIRPDAEMFPRPRTGRGQELETEDSLESSSRKGRAARPDTSLSAETKPGIRSSFIFSPKMSFTHSGGSNNTTSSTIVGSADVSAKGSDCSGSQNMGDLPTNTLATGIDEVKAWEEELVRIEIQSRRSSDLLGFAEKHAARLKALSLKRLFPFGSGKA